ncbi:MAG: type IV pilin [Methanoculleus sp.]|uniref:type IV pilin n=1 Tax=Methanoculleus sp. TaxID=90427 RepID=UPI002633D089|nr:type IV pilin [Methanoculleus sp.]MDD3217534.1 type IV pilin [Methanoculleus sp.]HOI59482.1 type IV pilin [Methanoculleus sp.]
MPGERNRSGEAETRYPPERARDTARERLKGLVILPKSGSCNRHAREEEVRCRIKDRPHGGFRVPPCLSLRHAAGSDCALSHTHATLLMVVITIILAALVLLMVLAMIPSWSWAEPELPPIIITGVLHTSGETGQMTYASRVFLVNNGSTVYENDRLRAVFYRDGTRTRTVSTLNGYLFIPTHHYGVRLLKGPGCRTLYWNPGEEIEVDLADKTFVPGVMVTVEIEDRRTGKVISKHTVEA